MMNSMEREIGFPLILRNNKGISLTTEGKKLLPFIRSLVRANTALEEEFSCIRGGNAGMVRIGSFPTTAYAWIPEILRRLHESYPGINVEVMEDNNINLLSQWLSQGIVDLAFFSRQSQFNFHWINLRPDPFVVLLPKNHILSKRDTVPVSKLAQEKVVLFRYHEGADPDTYNWLNQTGIQFNSSFTSNSDFTSIRVVEQNDYVAVMPELIARFAVVSHNVTYRPLDIKASREIGIAVRDREQLSPAAKIFLKFAKDSIAITQCHSKYAV